MIETLKDPKNLKYTDEDRVKRAFYPSDLLKPDLDLYFAFIGEPKTNKAKWNDTLKWGAGNGVEAQMLKILKQNGIVQEDYDQKTHGRIEIKREGIQINGYIDAISIDGFPIEIKSVNNANKFDISKYARNYPRESYVGQLSTYMDALDVDFGYLFVSSIDGLHYFVLECKKVGHRLYRCGNVTINLDKEYKRWAKLFKENIEPKIMPDPFQYVYKHDVNTLDWKAQTQNAISNARNGKAVIGDWEITWSPWKNRIIELQGSTLGYTNKELITILEKTKGYTTWFKKKQSTKEVIKNAKFFAKIENDIDKSIEKEGERKLNDLKKA